MAAQISKIIGKMQQIKKVIPPQTMLVLYY
jgi:hypothetical protein